MKSLWQFLGMVNFYRRFIPNDASILQPVSKLLKSIKKCGIVVSGDALSAFCKIKAALTKITELSHVLPDMELCLAVDASGGWSLGSSTTKIFWVKETYFDFPQKLTNTHKRYSTFGREL